MKLLCILLAELFLINIFLALLNGVILLYLFLYPCKEVDVEVVIFGLFVIELFDPEGILLKSEILFIFKIFYY